MSSHLSHRHHYVPKWYQHRFLDAGQTAFKILDLKPEVFRDKSGKVRGHGRSILDKGPDAHFWEPDLYTVRFLGHENDDIERLLFGAIDKSGQTAISAWLTEDYNTVHDTYLHMYEFMDALRLRTPKGLRFLQSLSAKQDQFSLMMAMQHLRRMHCIMWAEGTLEIVSAAESPTKFIFTDHPVTLFNSHVFPGNPLISPSQDPQLHWQGTQTLFPFDKDNLYVLTHVEWARSPGPNKAKKERTNARYFDSGTPMLWYNGCIRGRRLTEQQVLAANYIMKSRADRYVAGRSEDDLFPEGRLKVTQWNKVGQFLMPPQRALMNQSGYTVAAFGDGSYHFQDQYGRRPTTKAEYDREVERAKMMRADLAAALKKHEAEKHAAGGG